MQSREIQGNQSFSVKSIIQEIFNSSHQENRQMIDNAMFHTKRGKTSSLTFSFFRQVEPGSLMVSQAAEVFENNLQILKDEAKWRNKRDMVASEHILLEDLEFMADLSGCPSPAHAAICLWQSPLDNYRTISGLCNNRHNPTWGAANTALVRWLPAQYEDGEKQPKGWNHGRLHNGFTLPLVEAVSKKIMKSSFKRKENLYSQLMIEWGQFIDHDITFTPQSTRDATDIGVDCLDTCQNIHPCFPIQSHDLQSAAKGCMPFFRSSPACIDNLHLANNFPLQRQQINTITSFIDASVVYGHTLELQSLIRNYTSPTGRLAINKIFKDGEGRPYLPSVEASPSACFQNPRAPQEDPRVECFAAGDSRVNEGLSLIALHTLWLREHNRLAGALKVLNSHWSKETVYQETRKIIGALHQIITMRDYIPKIIGQESFDRYIGPYMGYDPTVNPSASNVFATAAFRFGHATISTVVRRFNESFQTHEQFTHLRLHHTFFSPWRIVKEGGIEPVLRGLMGTAATSVSTDKLIAEEMTEKLVVLNIQWKLDLAALNLQRGRDHALAGFNDWREFCGLKRLKIKEDFQDVVKDKIIVNKILKMYKNPDNIDVWLGGLVEDHLKDSRNGPLFSCLIAKQMKSIRDGDRFWWEAQGTFTKHQISELSKSSLSRIICDNSKVTEIPLDAFKYGKYPNGFLPCNHIPNINLEAWREKKKTDICDSPADIKNGDFLLFSSSGKLVAHYICYHGFRLKGTDKLECNESGWSDPPPECIDR
ncbi:thyroid peroxidase [Gadus morhua]|uniref:thyroid peroxidase n=1 Tax=Gadus morhua TaxID=8049 RepID=UPI0011B5F4FD|nr:thyroid peroxidase-like [Gadus morhua]